MSNDNLEVKKNNKPTIFLHSCCGPCSTAVIERLCEEYNVTVFFYNINITDTEEYLKRKAAQIQVIKNYNMYTKNHSEVKFIEGDYDSEVFLNCAKGFENEPEGGARCKICIELRMEETAKIAKELGYPIFSTTLSVSPHKDYNLICEIGDSLSKKYEIEFCQDDFKKKDGFKRSIDLSKEYGIYRQNYCGCEFSNWKKKKEGKL